MSEVLLNPNFSDGFNHWSNGIDGALAYTLYSQMARGVSDPSSDTVRVYKIKQAFTVEHTAISALLTVSAQWSAVLGGLTNGYNRFVVQIRKPDGTFYTAVDYWRSGNSGWGNILTNENVLAAFTTTGNYELWLTLYTRSAKDSASTSIGTPYASWSNHGFTVIGSEASLETIGAYKEAWITKSFTVGNPASASSLTVSARGVNNGTARAKVILVKPGGSEVTLANQALDGDTWINILNGYDFKAHVTVAGIYTLRLRAEVEAIFDFSRIVFGSASLSCAWPEYVQSTGDYNDNSLNVCLRLTKNVKECLGMGEAPGKDVAVSQKESLSFQESITSLHHWYCPAEVLRFVDWTARVVKKTVLERLRFNELQAGPASKIFSEERLGLLERVGLLVKKGAFEIVALAEALTWKLSKTVQEGLAFSESYASTAKYPRSASEGIAFSESISAKKTAGNIETAIAFGPENGWTPVTVPTTAWDKIRRETI